MDGGETVRRQKKWTWWQIALIVVGIVVLLALLTVGAFFIYERAAETSGPAPPENTVEARGFQFVPRTITVSKGTKVCWRNLASSGLLKHNVVQIDEDSCSAQITENGFTSGSPGQVDQYCKLFDEAGTFYYKCVPHCLPLLLAMRGTVIVTE